MPVTPTDRLIAEMREQAPRVQVLTEQRFVGLSTNFHVASNNPLRWAIGFQNLSGFPIFVNPGPTNNTLVQFQLTSGDRPLWFTWDWHKALVVGDWWGTSTPPTQPLIVWELILS